MATQRSVSVREHNKQLRLIDVLQSQVAELDVALSSEIAKRKKSEAKLKLVRAENRRKTLALNEAHVKAMTNELAKAKVITDAKEVELRGLQGDMRRENERLRLSLTGNVKMKGNLESLNETARSKNQHVISGGRAGVI